MIEIMASLSRNKLSSLFYFYKFFKLIRSGRMAKIPKQTLRECYNEINYYKVDFPENATTDQKGLLLGSSILVNALYFEHSE